MMDGPSLCPLIRHLLRKCHLPPCGGKALRAATWGRPYENFDPLCPVGADLRVRPPVLGAHIGAPLHGGGQVAPSSGLAGHLPPQGEGPARPGGRPYKETGAISPPVSLRSTAPSSEGAKENTPRKKPPSDEGGGICGANDGGRDRAATWGRPYES